MKNLKLEMNKIEVTHMIFMSRGEVMANEFNSSVSSLVDAMIQSGYFYMMEELNETIKSIKSDMFEELKRDGKLHLYENALFQMRTVLRNNWLRSVGF